LSAALQGAYQHDYGSWQCGCAEVVTDPAVRARRARTSPLGIFWALLSEVGCMPAAHPASSE